MGQLTGKVAVITGGAGGIGAVFARSLSERGACVLVADLNFDGASAVASEIAALGHEAVAAHLDVTDSASAHEVVDTAVSTFGGVDILVNSAALMAEIPFGPLLDYSVGWWDKVMNINVRGPFLCAQAAAPAMDKRGGGRIVNMVSAGAFQATGIYGISKYSLVGLTMNLASQLGARGITVNAIAPGLIDNEAGYRALPAGPFRDAIRSAVPLKNHIEGPPEDLIGTLMLLVSEDGSWITGQTISVDGGWVMRF